MCQLKTSDKSVFTLIRVSPLSLPDTDDIRLQADDCSELKHATCFFQLIYQSRLLRADVSEAVREEPWLPSLNRTLDSLRNLRTRLWTGGSAREDLVGAL